MLRYAILVLFAFPALMQADTVRLKDGTVLTGKMTDQDPSSIVLEVQGTPRSIPKSSIAAFREDDYGTSYYKERIAAEKEAREKRARAIDEAIAGYQTLTPTGLWIGFGAGQGRLFMPQESTITADRVAANFIPNGGQASAFLGFQGHYATGEDASIRYEGNRFYVDLSGFSYNTRIQTQALGLPPVSALFNPGSTSFYQSWVLDGTGLRQNASGVVGIEPVRFWAPLRLFFFAGKTGFNTTTNASGPLISTAVAFPTLFLSAYIRNIHSSLYGEGPRGGIQVRVQPAPRVELRLQAAAASFHGIDSDRGLVVFGPSNIPNFPLQLPTWFSNRGGVWVRQYEYSVTTYVSVFSRMRVFVGYLDEETRIAYGSRINQSFPGDLFITTLPSTGRWGEILLRYYDHPRHTGRFRRVTAGVEFRI